MRSEAEIAQKLAELDDQLDTLQYEIDRRIDELATNLRAEAREIQDKRAVLLWALGKRETL